MWFPIACLAGTVKPVAGDRQCICTTRLHRARKDRLWSFYLMESRPKLNVFPFIFLSFFFSSCFFSVPVRLRPQLGDLHHRLQCMPDDVRDGLFLLGWLLLPYAGASVSWHTDVGTDADSEYGLIAALAWQPTKRRPSTM